MAYLTYTIWSSEYEFRPASFEVSGEFYDLFENKKGHLRIEKISRDLVIDFAKDNGFTVNGNQIYK